MKGKVKRKGCQRKDSFRKSHQKTRQVTTNSTAKVTSKTTQYTQKGKGKTPIQAAVEDINNEDSKTCLICKQSFDIAKYTMGDWLKCDCEQWLHEDCLLYDFTEPYLCPVCADITL